MSNNHHIIFEGSECPTHQVLQDYLDDKLSGKDKHLLERHLVDCEMCSDELEGLSLITDRDKLGMIVEELKTKSLKNRSKIIPFFIRYKFASTAATIAILAAIVIILQLTINEDQQPLMAEKTEAVEAEEPPKGKLSSDTNKLTITPVQSNQGASPKKLEITPAVNSDIEYPPKQETIPIAENDNEEIYSYDLVDDDVEVEVPLSIVSSNVKNPVNGLYDSIDLSVSELEEIVVVAEKGETKSVRMAKATKIQADEIHHIPNQGDASTISMYTQSISSKKTRKSAVKSDMDRAMNKYHSEKYRSAVRIFEEVITNDSTNFRAMYYAALSYQKLDNTEKALIFVQRILSKKGNSYYSKAEILLGDLIK